MASSALIAIVGAYGGLLLVVLALATVTRRRRQLVRNSSPALMALDALNAEFAFRMPSEPALARRFADTVTSKAKFDRYSLRDYFLSCVLSHEAEFDAYIGRRLDALDAFHAYSMRVEQVGSPLLGSFTSGRLTPARYARIERRLFFKIALRPPQTVARVECAVSYRSPKGQNSYTRTVTWDFDALRHAVAEVRHIQETRQSAQFLRKQERNRMTDRLRADILRRDRYRCNMCGTTAQHGAVLHVDHIVAVSRGGKTTADNLQTLCQACNLGKSNRF